MAERTYGLFRNEANKRLIAKLQEQNADTALFPQLTGSPANDPRIFDLLEFDWIIFPDLYSVDFFLARVEEKSRLDELRICALGEAVSDRLRFSQVHADVIPAAIFPETVFSSIAQYQAPAGVKFLIPKAANACCGFSELLENAGAATAELPVYKIDEIPDAARFRSLLIGGAIDEFIFTSPQDVFSFAHFFGPGKADLTASAADEITFQTLREFGWQPKKSIVKKIE